MTDPALVSIILPVFNRAEFLREASAQVFAQTYRPLELIIVDDGSTDATGAVCDGIAAANPDAVRVVHRDNGGPGAARESGRLAARGEFLQYFDSDDQIDPQKIAVQVEALRANPDCGLAYCRTREFTRGEAHDGRCSQFTGENLDQLFPRLLSGCCWPTITPLIRREVSDEAGPWLPLRQEEDWEYDSRLAAARVKLVRCDEFLASAINHPGPRASGGGARDPQKFRDRCTARLLILDRALKAGIPDDDPDRRFFANSLFLFSRQCGAAGLADESRRLFAAACAAAGSVPLKNQTLFRVMAAVLGYARAGALCERLER
jgi:glycosyltransferase involved in cell wall biosynthesis